MAKTKVHKFHKIKIHHNRWLIWAVAYLLFVGLALVGYLKVSDLNIESESAADSVFLPALSYNAPSLGFALRYPNSWSIEANSANSISFSPSDTTDSGVTVLVTTPASEKSIRQSVKIASESRTNIGSVDGAKLINDLGDGHYETIVMAIHNHKLYVVRGSDNFVEKLLLTFRFIDNK